jgi:hypothetical protein
MVCCLQVTDGRRAEVEFTKDWKLDANRKGKERFARFVINLHFAASE